LMAVTGLASNMGHALENQLRTSGMGPRPTRTRRSRASNLTAEAPAGRAGRAGSCPSCGCPWQAKRARGDLDEGVTARVQTRPVPDRPGGIKTAEVGCTRNPDPDTLGSVGLDARRLATYSRRFRAPVAGVKIHRHTTGQETRDGGDPWPATLHPELYQGRPRSWSTSRPQRRRECGGVQTAAGRSRSVIGKSWCVVRRDAQAVGDHPGTGRRDPQAGKGRLHGHDFLADRRPKYSRKKVVEGPEGPKAKRCSRSPTSYRLVQAPGLRGTARLIARGSGGRGRGIPR